MLIGVTGDIKREVSLGGAISTVSGRIGDTTISLELFDAFKVFEFSGNNPKNVGEVTEITALKNIYFNRSCYKYV